MHKSLSSSPPLSSSLSPSLFLHLSPSIPPSLPLSLPPSLSLSLSLSLSPSLSLPLSLSSRVEVKELCPSHNPLNVSNEQDGESPRCTTISSLLCISPFSVTKCALVTINVRTNAYYSASDHNSFPYYLRSFSLKLKLFIFLSSMPSSPMCLPSFIKSSNANYPSALHFFISLVGSEGGCRPPTTGGNSFPETNIEPLLLSTVMPINPNELLEFDNFPNTVDGAEESVFIEKDPELRTRVVLMLHSTSKISFPVSTNNHCLVLQFRYQSRFVSFSLSVIDTMGRGKSVTVTNNRSTVKIDKDEVAIPLVISNDGWQILKIDIDDILLRCFGTRFMSCKAVAVEGM